MDPGGCPQAVELGDIEFVALTDKNTTESLLPI